MSDISTLFVTIISAFLGAIIGPLLIFIYKKKYEAFDTVVRTFFYLYNDKTKEPSKNEAPSSDNLSENTKGLIQKANDLVTAHFTNEAYRLFDEAIRVRITRENGPNQEFHDKKTKAIKRMKRELLLHWVPFFLSSLLFLTILFYFGYLFLN